MTHELGPLPEPGTRTDWHHDGYGKPAYTADQMRAYAAQEVAKAVAAERERCARIAEAYDPSRLVEVLIRQGEAEMENK